MAKRGRFVEEQYVEDEEEDGRRSARMLGCLTLGLAFFFLLVAIGLFWILFLRGPVAATCEAYPITEHSPTGIVGCETYGEGVASRWPGPGIARNDCVWPWEACRPIQITSPETGRSIIVVPTMYCDCLMGTAGERLVDLDPSAVEALGLDWSRGLYPVSVEPASIYPNLPDTALAP